MYVDPGLDPGSISGSLAEYHGIDVGAITFLPLGHDPYAAVYEVVARDGTPYFLKIRFGPVHAPSLLVPAALRDRGVDSVLAPIPTRVGALSCPLDAATVVLYPFIRGENAMVAGLSDNQWREFGAALRAVHASGLADHLRATLPVETLALPSAALVREIQALVATTEFDGPAAARFAAFWRRHANRIAALLARAESLGRELQTKTFDLVLCHADIHAANILVGGDGRIHLIDWDGPLIAPPERDLLFVVGSTTARAVEPREEALFFDSYGPVEIDPDALIYYRYERIIEDLGEFGKSVFLHPTLSEAARANEAGLGMGFFEPGGMIDTAETVTLHGPARSRQ